MVEHDGTQSPQPRGLTRPEDYISSVAAAEILGVSPQTIRNRIDAGRLQGHKEIEPGTGRILYRVKLSAIDRRGVPERLGVELEDVTRRYAESLDALILSATSEVQGALERQAVARRAQHAELVRLLRRQSEALERNNELLEALSALCRLRSRATPPRPWWAFWRRVSENTNSRTPGA